MTKKINPTDTKTGRKQAQILGISLNSTSRARLLRCVSDFISYNNKFFLVTPNPEIILAAQKDPVLLAALNRANLAIPDGVGLKLAEPSLKIIKGRQVFMALVSLAAKKGWRVFLLGGLHDEAKIASSKLKLQSPKLKVMSCAGPVLDNDAKPVSERDIAIESDAITKINRFRPHLLFVGFGAPKQEKWVAKWLPKLDTGGAMTVGGTFRSLAGLTPLPPKWLESAGFEWLWRLIHEPRRLSRILNAVVVFPWKVFLAKLSKT